MIPEEAPLAVERSRRDTRSGLFLDRQGFAAEHRLIDGTPSLGHGPVGGDLPSGENADEVAGMQIRNAHFLVSLRSDEQGARGREVEEFPEC